MNGAMGLGGAAAWAEACRAARLFAADPHGIKGIRLIARAGPVRDRWLALLQAHLETRPVKRIPPNIDAERLIGGLDLAATLSSGMARVQAGVLSEADGGVVIMPMAERMASTIATTLAAALDDGEIAVERDGLALRLPARIGVVLLDEGEADEAPPAALIERIAITICLDGVSMGDCGDAKTGASPTPRHPELVSGSMVARDMPPPARADESHLADSEAITALCEMAFALGIDSARPPLLALAVARAAACADDRTELTEDYLAIATRLVLMPRARRFPDPAEDDDAPEEIAADDLQPDAQSDGEMGELAERVVEAARAQLPPDVLAGLAQAAARSRQSQSGKGSAGLRKSLTRGRPIGVRPGKPGSGARLHLIETLRAAAPWQTLRRGQGAGDRSAPMVRVRPSDFRIRRFAEKSEATLIFVVDASGSAAAERLAETKGAVELLLAEAYVKRTQVALVAFRGPGAEIVLPPTRSLVRAKKVLADLAGGGGTPLGAGILAGQLLAEAERGRGRTPFTVLMTDGRANVAASGAKADAAGEADAAATRFGAAGLKAVLIDVSARPRDDARRIASAMGAAYAALPRVDAQAMRAIVASAQ